MLRFISIRNLAVIDRLEVEFEPGLNVLTGETGAGKSILVGAVGCSSGAARRQISCGRERSRRRSKPSSRTLPAPS
jgi:DNA repair ATPase RecN